MLPPGKSHMLYRGLFSRLFETMGLLMYAPTSPEVQTSEQHSCGKDVGEMKSRKAESLLGVSTMTSFVVGLLSRMHRFVGAQSSAHNLF